MKVTPVGKSSASAFVRMLTGASCVIGERFSATGFWPTFAARFGVSRRVGGYGSTETNLVFNADDGWDVPGNMGFATEGFEVAVVDAQDQPVPAGTAGELVVRSQVPFVHFLCYWGNPGASPRPDEICAFLESRLARFAIPRYLELSDALPLTDTGKVNRSKLKERGLTAATWDREAVGGEPHVHR